MTENTKSENEFTILFPFNSNSLKSEGSEVRL